MAISVLFQGEFVSVACNALTCWMRAPERVGKIQIHVYLEHGYEFNFEIVPLRMARPSQEKKCP